MAARAVHEYFGPRQHIYTCPKLDVQGCNTFIKEGLWIDGIPCYAAGYVNNSTGEAFKTADPETFGMNKLIHNQVERTSFYLTKTGQFERRRPSTNGQVSNPEGEVYWLSECVPELYILKEMYASLRDSSVDLSFKGYNGEFAFPITKVLHKKADELHATP